MDTSIDIVYAEVYEILKGISKEKVALIPKDIILKIKENRSKNYQVEIDWSKDLEENNFSDTEARRKLARYGFRNEKVLYFIFEFRW